MTKSRSLSLIVAGVYILIAYMCREAVPTYMWYYLLVPMGWGLACIWFGDELGSIVGARLGNARITSTTPGGVVRFVGWLLLVLLPIAAFILQRVGIKYAGG